MGIAAAVLLFAHAAFLIHALGSQRVQGSRRLLVASLLLTIPGFGMVIAFLVLSVTGNGDFSSMAADSSDDSIMADSMGPLEGHHNAMLDRLLNGERSEALAVLAHVGGAEAVSLLRWTVENSTESEAVLDAALALEELSNSHEYQLAEACRAAEENPCFGLSMIAANTASAAILSGLADVSQVAVLLGRARHLYQQAIDLAPDRWATVVERWGELEVHVTHPEITLDLLANPPSEVYLDSLDEGARHRLDALKANAAFAARRFDLQFGAVTAA